MGWWWWWWGGAYVIHKASCGALYAWRMFNYRVSSYMIFTINHRTFWMTLRFRVLLKDTSANSNVKDKVLDAAIQQILQKTKIDNSLTSRSSQSEANSAFVGLFSAADSLLLWVITAVRHSTVCRIDSKQTTLPMFVIMKRLVSWCNCVAYWCLFNNFWAAMEIYDTEEYITSYWGCTGNT